MTVVSFATSAPELIVSLNAALDGYPDIALGNVIGSNMFNTLGVLGVTGLIHPAELASGVLSRDLPLMIILTLLLFFMASGFRGQGKITRVEGSVLLAIFIAYEILLYTEVAGG